MSLEKALGYLAKAGYREQVIQLGESTATVAMAAEALGVHPLRIAKTMSFLQGDKAVLIITEGTAKIDNRKYKDTFHVKAKMIPFEEVENIIGHAPGGVCPFGINEGIDIYLDESLKQFDVVYPAAGDDHSAVKLTVEHLLSQTNTNVRKITTEEMRDYLANYQKRNNCSNVTVDNVRRNISSFFSWLEEEDYILKSPMKRIHKIKTKTVVKNTISDEGIEKLRDNCKEKRDLAIIDLLYSTGIRVGELVNLNIDDIDLEGRECVVYGKGDKERRVYFDAKAKVHLKEYIAERHDNNKALFVTLDAPHDRLKISGVELRLRRLGRKLELERIHPHKFRRSMATRAIDKGMPIEQVQKILGHSQIDTTMQYAMVNQTNVKTSHQKYMS